MSDQENPASEMTPEEIDEYIRKPCPECGQRLDDAYCTTCGSCGSNGCCHPGQCVKVSCKYGDMILDQYEDDQEKLNRWYLALGQLGVYEQFKITEEIAKQVGDAKFGNKTLRQIIDGLLRPILPEYNYDIDEYKGPWSPIDTAPKDGTRILLYRKFDGCAEGWWGAHFYRPENKSDFGKGEFSWGRRGFSYPTGSEPTHWMPLPMPPEE